MTGISVPALARTTVNVTVLSDIGGARSTELKAVYLEELESLTQGEFRLQFTDTNIDWHRDPVQQVEQIYADPNMDMLLVLGFAANQLMITRGEYPKPTFLPFVVESELVGAPLKEDSSGKKNLNYLTYSLSFLDAVEVARDVVHFDKLAVIADTLVLSSIPDNLPEMMTGRFAGMQMNLISIDDTSGDVLGKLPPDTDGVMIGLVPRLSEQQMDNLIAGLIERKIPSFTYLGTDLVHRGVLATPTNDTLLLTAARRNALNMQAVMLGESASTQPVMVQTKTKLTINQATAEKIGAAIAFRTLINSEVIGFGEGLESRAFDLVGLVRTALQQNLQIQDQQYTLEIQDNAQRLSRAALLPQVGLGASRSLRRDDSDAVLSGVFPEQSTDVALSINQSLFSDSEWANYAIQRYLYQAGGEQFRQVQLDVIRETALAMADVLQAQAEAEIQQRNLSFSEKNLELANDRIAVGASSSADQYRWQTQVANGKSAVFQSYASVLIAEQNLNRLLNRPIQSPIHLAPLDLDGFTVFRLQNLFTMMDNIDSFERMYQIGLQVAYDSSPEITRLEYLQRAKQREVKTLSRQRWMPNLSLNGQYSDNIDQTGLQHNEGAGSDWQVTLNAQFPLFRGGQISAQRRQGVLEREQLGNQLALLKQQIAQTLRSNMNNLLTSLFSLEFSTDAATAAQRSLDLVTDSYSKGAVPVVDLLDAQNASVTANLAQVQASISLFRAGIEMQRVTGEFDFLMSDQQKKEQRELIEQTIRTGVYQPRATEEHNE